MPKQNTMTFIFSMLGVILALAIIKFIEHGLLEAFASFGITDATTVWGIVVIIILAIFFIAQRSARKYVVRR